MDDHYGNIYINFSTPFSLKEYIKDVYACGENNKNIVPMLAHEIIYRFVNLIYN